MRVLSSEVIPELVRAGEIHLSFQALSGQTIWPGLAVIPYKKDSLVAAVAVDHALASRRGVTLETLAQERFVDLTPDRALRKLIDHEFTARRLHRFTAFEVSELQMAVQFVAKGLGVAILPSIAAETYAEPESLAFLRITNTTPAVAKWRIGILRRPGSAGAKHKSAVDLFLETVSSIS